MKAEIYYLSQAGKTIEIVFAPTEFSYLRENIINQFKEVWGDFLSQKGKGDFIIEVVPEESKDNVFVRERGKKYYFLTFVRDFRKKKVTAFYSLGIRNLDILFKEVFAYLVEKDGFLLHCSSIKDKKGNLLAFLARSGGGKTTTAANILGKGTRFGDDIIIVRKLKGKWHYYSPPFIEKDRAPVKNEAVKGSFYLVEKTKEPYLKKIQNKKEILPFLLGQIWLRERILSKKNLGSAISFLNSQDFYKLGATLNKLQMRRLFK